MMKFLLALLMANTFASTESLNIFDSSFPRDNSFCNYKGKKVEFLIRGVNKFTDLKERGIGEYFFYRSSDQKPKLLEISKTNEDAFHLFSQRGDLCSKSHSYLLGDDLVAFLLLKDNSPFKEKLVIQVFDFKTMTAKESIDTNLPTTHTIKSDKGFNFKTFPEHFSREMGKINIQEIEYIYQEMDFPIWMNYSYNSLFTNLQMTYEEFPYKKYFKDLGDFQASASWDDKAKKFTREILYVAVNHKLKKECIFFANEKQKIMGDESWKCQTKI